jgi:hypothetical protein
VSTPVLLLDKRNMLQSLRFAPAVKSHSLFEHGSFQCSHFLPARFGKHKQLLTLSAYVLCLLLKLAVLCLHSVSERIRLL